MIGGDEITNIANGENHQNVECGILQSATKKRTGFFRESWAIDSIDDANLEVSRRAAGIRAAGAFDCGCVQLDCWSISRKIVRIGVHRRQDKGKQAVAQLPFGRMLTFPELFRSSRNDPFS